MELYELVNKRAPVYQDIYGRSVFTVISEAGLKTVAQSPCYSRSGRAVPHSFRFVCEDGAGRLWVILGSYGSFVGAVNYWNENRYLVNDCPVWTNTTKRAFGVLKADIEREGRGTMEIVDIIRNA